MDAIEAMARARWEAQNFGASFDDLEDYEQVEELASMRAALIALRDCEVTDAMRNAYCGAIDANVTRDTPKRVLRDVINAILEERDV